MTGYCKRCNMWLHGIDNNRKCPHCGCDYEVVKPRDDFMLPKEVMKMIIESECKNEQKQS